MLVGHQEFCLQVLTSQCLKCLTCKVLYPRHFRDPCEWEKIYRNGSTNRQKKALEFKKIWIFLNEFQPSVSYIISPFEYIMLSCIGYVLILQKCIYSWLLHLILDTFYPSFLLPSPLWVACITLHRYLFLKLISVYNFLILNCNRLNKGVLIWLVLFY
jgi:hypothetical protein